MRKQFINIFIGLATGVCWLQDRKYLGLPNLLKIILLIILAWVVYRHFLEESGLANNIFLALTAIALYLLFMLLSLQSYPLFKPPKFIRKTAETPIQLFDLFSHRSFLYGIFIYSFFASGYIVSILFLIIHELISINLDVSKLYYNSLFITQATFSVLYFMYHVAVKNIPTKAVKARIKLYAAITATIAAGVFGLSLKEILFPLVTYLGLGLAWLNFFVEQIESEA
jgi:hypothetical protein